VQRIYKDTRKVNDPRRAVVFTGSQARLDGCCTISDSQRLVDCLRAARPQDLTSQYASDPALTQRIFQYIKQTGSPLQSALEMGSGKGNWMLSLGHAGVETVVGIEPAYMGSIGFYEDAWDVKYMPVQLDAMLGDKGIGDLQINAFLCERFGSKKHQFDLVWTVEVFEHIPKGLHCGMLNKLAAYAREWVLTSIAPPGQPGRGHISPMIKRDWRREWELRGFQEVQDAAVATIFNRARWGPWKKNPMLMRRTEPEKSVDCVAL